MKPPIILSIAGSDSSGGAGIQADIKTAAALGVYAATAITAVTVQNTEGVRGILPVPAHTVKAQIEAVMDDVAVDAVKTGMLGSPETVRAVAEAVDKYRPRFVVIDPVMVSTSGHTLATEETAAAIRELLFPRATLITPNIDEAKQFTGTAIRTVEEMIEVGKKLIGMGCNAVLMKGGHLAGEQLEDVLLHNRQLLHYKGQRINTRNTHGTGCTLSSAIACYLALNNDLKTAVGLAKLYLAEALQGAALWELGRGHGPVNHAFAIEDWEIVKKQILKKD
jgi:hydroxymethylpyrimidine/phosphomethylpyrimidine kinase